MRPVITPGMVEVSRLTREGRLREATQLIQRLLQGGADSCDPDPHAGGEHDRKCSGLLPRPAHEDLAHGESDGPPQDAEFPSKDRRARTFKSDGGFSLDEWIDKALALSQIQPSLHGLAPGNSLKPADIAPSQGLFSTATYSGPSGARDYKLYVPGSRRADGLPLIVMLHGCTQSADDFAAGTRMNFLAEEHGFLVAYPIQPQSANGSKCWNWFKRGDQMRGQGEPAILAGLTQTIAREHRADRQRIYVAGLSAGGATAAVLGTTYPDIFAAIGVHSGLPCGAARDLSSALAAMRQGAPGQSKTAPPSLGFHGQARLVPAIVFHGDKDTTVHPRNSHHVIDQFRPEARGQLMTRTQHGHVSGGHGYVRTCHLDPQGRVLLEMWIIRGAGHAWSGGSPNGTYTDPRGPNASLEMVRFFLQQRHPHPSLENA